MTRRALIAAACAAAASAGAAPPAGAATVETMVVGEERVLRSAGEVRLRERRVRVGGRRCTVGRATALSVLAGLHLRVRVRDYGSCGRSPRDAGGLYVTQVGSEREGGRGGWVYKVGRRAGSGAAADPSGPFGTGRRLRDGDRVLWFWCELDSGDGCQRTLEVRPARSEVAPGAPLAVTVRGYDNAGDGVPVAGATVRLDGASALTGPDGTATLTAPSEPGSAELDATAEGMVRLVPARGARGMRRACLALACLLAAAAPGCGFGAGEEEPGGDVTVTVTRNFGDEQVGPSRTRGVREGDTVMRLLQRDFEVETRFGGGFVHEIDGVAGGQRGGRRVDWFFYVNGIEAGEGAASRELSPSDRIWWDHHDWTAAMRIPAVVGSFPEPFASGSQGKRLPVRLVCEGDVERTCDEVATRLENAGVKQIARSLLVASAGKNVLRLVVGLWPDIRRDAAVRQLEDGPATSGVFARPLEDGARLELLDHRGRSVRALGPGSGLVAATRGVDQQPTWVVTGTDPVGLAAAAAALTEEQLRDRFAVAVERGRGIALPVPSPGSVP